jgi:hypothetical protein
VWNKETYVSKEPYRKHTWDRSRHPEVDMFEYMYDRFGRNMRGMWKEYVCLG